LLTLEDKIQKIRIGIAGYGNLGKGVELALAQNPDMQLAAVVSRRPQISVQTPNIAVVSPDEAHKLAGSIDVMILCGDSATDLPKQTPSFARWFHIIDSYDNHSSIPDHFAAVDNAAKQNGKLGIISVGWDPGLFSINRLYGECLLPQGKHYTFWGSGVSQGHSDAVRRIEGIEDAVQYTLPSLKAVEAVRSGTNPQLSTRQKHKRVCYVVAAPNADRDRIESEIKTMPAYFAEYDTTVHFVSKQEFAEKNKGYPHGGFVFRSGTTANRKNGHVIEYSLKLDPNPEFTASVMVAYARAAYRLASQGCTGCLTVFDIPPAMLSVKKPEQIRRELL